MNEHFRNSLRQEIELMLKNEADQVAKTNRQKGHATHMSESNISVASSSNFTLRDEEFVLD